MDWLNILIFGVIPVLTVVIMFLIKKKMLWVSPIISTVLAFVGLTAIAYFVAYILKRKK